MSGREITGQAPPGAFAGNAYVTPINENVDEKDVKQLETAVNATNLTGKDVDLKNEGVIAVGERDGSSDEGDGEGQIIVTGADAAAHLLPMRDDHDPVITLRSMVLATGFAAFNAVIVQITYFKPTTASITPTFIVLLSYFVGNAWGKFLPRGDLLENKWRAGGGAGALPFWIRFWKIVNDGPWSLKEHAICAITASSASNASAVTFAFSSQRLFYNMSLDATTVVLSLISIGLFGYGLCGIFRPITVWHVEAVYWSNIPVVKSLQTLHWDSVKNSKPLRYFWYAASTMFTYEFIPAYMFPWLNSVSIPCLAAQNASGNTGQTLTNIFGGATNNEGLGLFTFSFDWQYIQSFSTSLPFKFQLHQAAGYVSCMIIMVGLYYGNAWDALSQPFMSTRLRFQNGTRYPVGEVFPNGVLNETALEEFGVPRLAATFAFALFMANAAIGALIAHIFTFWGKDIVDTVKRAWQGRFDDRHHDYMAKTYKEVPWWWYMGVLALSFVLGIIVAVKEDISLPVWAYIVAVIFGIVIAPMSSIIYSRFGNGIATNNLSKMLAGLLLPGRPIGNMYFAVWSHNIIINTVNLSSDLKMGEYLKIPPRQMFLTQVWGTVFGGFINYVVMNSVINNNFELLANSNGDSSWSGAQIQSYNTNAAAWALSRYLYTYGQIYFMVPMGILIGAAAVIAHYILYRFKPTIGKFDISEINLPQYIQYAGFIPYNQSQTCIIASTICAGFFVQYYLRLYRPRIFKDYSYIVTAAWDAGSLTAVFILTFAVFGGGGISVPFPDWWGNNVNGNYDWCPTD